MDRFEEEVKKSSGHENWWKFEPGEYLIGRYKEKKQIRTKNGLRWIIVIENEITGKDIVTFLYAVIQKRFEEEGVQFGERVGIKFLEARPNYKLFTVMVDREGSDVKI